MFIKNVIVASSLILAVVGFNSTARATDRTNLDQPTTRYSFSEELQIPQQRTPERDFGEPRQDRLFSEPFYEGSPQPIRRYTLEPGTQGTQVTGLQQRLQVHGFDPGRIDSVFGPRTEQALRAFQRARGLEANGIVDRGTWRLLEASPQLQASSRLEASPQRQASSGLETSPQRQASSGLETSPQSVAVENVLTKGNRGSKVLTLQTRLQVKGYDPGPVDGIFGNLTQAAVIAYQESKGLEKSGVVDEKTWTALSQEWR